MAKIMVRSDFRAVELEEVFMLFLFVFMAVYADDLFVVGGRVAFSGTVDIKQLGLHEIKDKVINKII